MMLRPLVLATLFLLPACTSDSTASATAGGAEESCSSCDSCMEHEPVASAPAKGITLTEATPISAILADPAKFEGKRVLVAGAAVDVCAKRGCWVDLKSDGDAGKKIRVKVQDGEIVFPMTCKGNEVTVEGVVEKVATASGGTGWWIRGLGAKFDS